jgi:hypothetical protein
LEEFGLEPSVDTCFRNSFIINNHHYCYFYGFNPSHSPFKNNFRDLWRRQNLKACLPEQAGGTISDVALLLKGWHKYLNMISSGIISSTIWQMKIPLIPANASSGAVPL